MLLIRAEVEGYHLGLGVHMTMISSPHYERRRRLA